ncbi:MAG: class II aldolase/adducin family protein [Cyclobacteriaceae bacterium]|nr:class II aldolase/adducin family protein [Cyclobacteriaceae bacterium]
MINPQLHHPKDQITEIIRRIYRAGMTTTSGGNISIKDMEGNIWVTPSAVDKGSLTRKDIICVKPDGEVIGLHKPSSEFPFHKAIYDIRPDIKAVVHAHPPALVSFSIVRKIPNTNIIPQAKSVCGPIGYAPYALPGSEALGEKIAREFAAGFDAVIMENHGIVIGGTSLSDAFIRFEALEFSARTIIGANTVGEVSYLSDDQIAMFENAIPSDIPVMEKVEYPSDELAIRTNISELVRRACNQGLMISTYGTVSVRWYDNNFLITPRNIPRWDIDNEDIVQIRHGKRESGKLPSRALKLIEQIYIQNPEVNSVILTQSPNIMAFGVSDAQLDVRTIPESWIFLQDIPVVPFGKQFAGNDTIPQLLSKNTPSVIIQNDSIIVTGDKLLQTFDRLEVAEFSAKSLIMSKSIGELVPINDQQIEDLRLKFLS